jgi:hypothetical protein
MSRVISTLDAAAAIFGTPYGKSIYMCFARTEIINIVAK